MEKKIIDVNARDENECFMYTCECAELESVCSQACAVQDSVSVPGSVVACYWVLGNACYCVIPACLCQL